MARCSSASAPRASPWRARTTACWTTSNGSSGARSSAGCKAVRAPAISPTASRASDCRKRRPAEAGRVASPSSATRSLSPGNPRTVSAPLRRYHPSSVRRAPSHTESSAASASPARLRSSAPRACSKPTSSATAGVRGRGAMVSSVPSSSARSSPLRPSGEPAGAPIGRGSVGAIGTSAREGDTFPVGEGVGMPALPLGKMPGMSDGTRLDRRTTRTLEGYGCYGRTIFEQYRRVRSRT